MKCTTLALRFLLLLAIPLTFWQCDDDDDKGSGELRFEITDGPADDEGIQGVFVTIAEIKVDGETWNGLTANQTINVSALQNGNVQSLGIAEFAAEKYDQITLVLDLEEDEDGNSPGCYVMKDGQKHNLATSSSAEWEIDINGSDFEVVDGSTKTIVIDFDLRKSLRYGNSHDTQSDYAFGTTAELEGALRYVAKDKSGHIEGTSTDIISNSELTVVYAYRKGEYDRASEVSGPSDEQFTDAVTSAIVDSQGEYRISWLEEGEYELVFASYQDEGNNGTMDLQGTLNLDTVLGIDIKSISVGVSSTVTVDVTITGLLPV